MRKKLCGLYKPIAKEHTQLTLFWAVLPCESDVCGREAEPEAICHPFGSNSHTCGLLAEPSSLSCLMAERAKKNA